MKNTSLQSSLQEELKKCKLKTTKVQKKNENLEKRIAEVIKAYVLLKCREKEN